MLLLLKKTKLVFFKFLPHTFKTHVYYNKSGNLWLDNINIMIIKLLYISQSSGINSDESNFTIRLTVSFKYFES